MYIYKLESAKKKKKHVNGVGIESRFSKSKVKSRFAGIRLRSTSTRVDRTRVGLGYSNMIRGIGWQASGQWHIS